MNDESVTCGSCLSQFVKNELARSCGNCFCCTGCEVYICANCKSEIVVKPVGKPIRSRYHSDASSLNS